MKRRESLHTILIISFITLVAAPLMWSCNEDEPDYVPGYKSGNNTNNQGYYSEDNTNRNNPFTNPYSARLEIPRLKGGATNLFLVKQVGGMGVNFCIEWDCMKKAQRWTAFRWDRSYKDTYMPRSESWSEDYDIPEAYRTSQKSYSGTGYTRGHICASADRRNSYEANAQTFLYSNMQPQLYDFNGGIWLDLENKIRTWNTDNFRDTLYVVKGGTIDNNSKILETTRTGLIVPKYFFMALLCKNKSTSQGGYKAMGFYIEHRDDYAKNTNLRQFACSIKELEERTGIDFFCNLPDELEKQVESNFVPIAWGFSN